jgi:RNase adaptor protein for sRNA GlmZ degradation
MDTTAQLRVILFSFGFKYGMPIDVNQLWDVRFLPNPYWVSELRPKNGKEPEVAGYVLASPAGRNFWGHLQPLLLFLVKENLAADKHTLRIAIGCTGGRHRSVAVTEKIAALLSGQPIQLTVFHRDIARDE